MKNRKAKLDNGKAWIVGDSGTLGGGTRLSVAHVLEWFAEGGTLNGFLKEYPHVPAEGVQAARSGRIAKKLYATASSPLEGIIEPAKRPGKEGIPGE
ncbi:MAG: DUF433 domain-containing protein [Planctomycetes bacterium]|nr:DUF433 domain-containing protein [Planctomycetota bacterium]